MTPTDHERDAPAQQLPSVRIVVVDDHAVLRAGLCTLVSSTRDLEVCGTAPDGETAIRLVEHCRPDVVVMDVAMPGMGGLAATAAITAAHPGIRVLILSCFSDAGRVRLAFAAGATGYVVKSAEPSALLNAVRAVAVGERYVDALVTLVTA